MVPTQVAEDRLEHGLLLRTDARADPLTLDGTVADSMDDPGASPVLAIAVPFAAPTLRASRIA